MACLELINLTELVNRFKPTIFFETGSGAGNGIKAALKYPFKRIISIEIMDKQVDFLKNMFKDEPRVELVCGTSLEKMEEIIPTLEDEIIFFWLDAHFPGADLHMAECAMLPGINCDKYDNDFKDSLRLPLHHELDLIKKLRNGKKDIIMADDLSIYFTPEKVGDAFRPREKDFDRAHFLKAFQDTHEPHFLIAGYNPPLGADDLVGVLIPK